MNTLTQVWNFFCQTSFITFNALVIFCGLLLLLLRTRLSSPCDQDQDFKAQLFWKCMREESAHSLLFESVWWATEYRKNRLLLLLVCLNPEIPLPPLKNKINKMPVKGLPSYLCEKQCLARAEQCFSNIGCFILIKKLFINNKAIEHSDNCVNEVYGHIVSKYYIYIFVVFCTLFIITNNLKCCFSNCKNAMFQF